MMASHAQLQMQLRLHRDAHGRLVLTDDDGMHHVGVLPVRAFPLTAPDHGISLVGSDGRELRWLDSLDGLAPPVRVLLDEELAARDFAPTLLKLHAVSSFGVPSTWRVATDRGEK